MKKARLHPLLLVTALFAALLLGFFVVRNGNRPPVPVQTIPNIPLSTEAEAPSAPDRININTATPEQLRTLPGIGETYARRIVEYREENGPFRSVGELANVEGIGEKRLEALWDLVTTGG